MKTLYVLTFLLSINLFPAFSNEIPDSIKNKIIGIVLTNKTIEDALFKESRREMYPMYIVYNKEIISFNSINGFSIDTLSIAKEEYNNFKSVLKISKFDCVDNGKVANIELIYNDKIRIRIKASKINSKNSWRLSNILIKSETSFQLKNDESKVLVNM